MRKNRFIKFFCILGIGAYFFLNTSCVEKFLPDVQEAFDREVNFTQQLYKPVLGRQLCSQIIFNQEIQRSL